MIEHTYFKKGRFFEDDIKAPQHRSVDRFGGFHDDVVENGQDFTRFLSSVWFNPGGKKFAFRVLIKQIVVNLA